MGLFSFVKTAGRKLGLFGGQEAAAAEEAKEKAAAAAAEAEAAADDATREALRRQAVAADIQAAILSYVPIDALSAGYDGDIVSLFGTAATQADREKAVLVAGNTEGIAQVDDQLEVAEPPEPPAVFHTVVSGDTLSKIADAQYGVMRMFDVIFEANTPMLKHPDEIYPGQVLRIPPVQPPVHTVESGQTLGTIAKHWYGDAGRYTDIFEANRATLDDPNVVEVGQQLTIPLRRPANV